MEVKARYRRYLRLRFPGNANCIQLQKKPLYLRVLGNRIQIMMHGKLNKPSLFSDDWDGHQWSGSQPQKEKRHPIEMSEDYITFLFVQHISMYVMIIYCYLLLFDGIVTILYLLLFITIIIPYYDYHYHYMLPLFVMIITKLPYYYYHYTIINYHSYHCFIHFWTPPCHSWMSQGFLLRSPSSVPWRYQKP